MFRFQIPCFSSPLIFGQKSFSINFQTTQSHVFEIVNTESVWRACVWTICRMRACRYSQTHRWLSQRPRHSGTPNALEFNSIRMRSAHLYIESHHESAIALYASNAQRTSIRRSRCIMVTTWVRAAPTTLDTTTSSIKRLTGVRKFSWRQHLDWISLMSSWR